MSAQVTIDQAGSGVRSGVKSERWERSDWRNMGRFQVTSRAH